MTDDAQAPAGETERDAAGRAWFSYVTTLPRQGAAESPLLSVASRGFCFGEVWGRPGLDTRSRRLITLACVALLGVEVPMRSHIYGALKSGDLTFEEMREAVLHFGVYAGLPKASLFDQIVTESWARVQAEGGPVKLEPPPAT